MAGEANDRVHCWLFPFSFGKHDDHDAEAMIIQVATEAMAIDAGVGPADIDAIYVGQFGRFERQEFTSSLVFQASDEFRFKPSTRVENACATGSAAVHQAANYIEANAAAWCWWSGSRK